MLSEREQRVRKGLRKEKCQRWKYITDLERKGSSAWQDFWAEHWPPDKLDMRYIFGRDSTHLRRHVRIELHYLRQSEERRFQLEQMFAGENK